MKILIVEDTLIHRRLMEKILHEDFELIFAPDAFEAYHYLKDDPKISVLMVDYHMPFVNGDDFVRKVKSEDCFADLPIILVTDQETRETYSGAMESGATSFLLKPFSGENLKKILANYVKVDENV